MTLTEKKIINYLRTRKRTSPSMCGATIWVIKDECNIRDIEKIDRICEKLKDEGKLKQFKKYKHAYEYLTLKERKK